MYSVFQVIQEIDDMMQESSPGSEDDIIEHNEALEKGKEVLSSPLYEDSQYNCSYNHFILTTSN